MGELTFLSFIVIAFACKNGIADLAWLWSTNNNVETNLAPNAANAINNCNAMLDIAWLNCDR